MFGRKSAWLALSDAEARDVADELGLVSVRNESPETAIAEVERYSAGAVPVLVVTPEKWALVLITPLTDAEPWNLARLSAKFGDAQRFVSHRIVEYYVWERWIDGDPRRRYGWLGERGEVLFDEGEPAQAEGRIVRASDDFDEDWSSFTLPTEETVLDVAREWSVDPTTVQLSEDERSAVLGYIDPTPSAASSPKAG